VNFHPAGQALKVWVEAVSDTSFLEYKSTVASLTAYGSTNGETPVLLSGVTAVFNANMDMFLITIPANQLPANGHNFFVKVDWTGIIDVKLEVYITPSFVTTSEITQDILDTTIEGSFSFAEILRVMAAVLAGNSMVSGSTVTYTGLDGSTTRLSAVSTVVGRSVSSRDGD
jgi:hypothetical protein